MRVLVSPRMETGPGGSGAGLAERLAGRGKVTASLREAGVPDLSRRQSEAEVYLLRRALLGADPGRRKPATGESDDIVGYICRGVGKSDDLVRGGVVAVTDHANLTWRSPLLGPNDDRLGPRFPSMNGVYAPEIVTVRLRGIAGRSGEGMMVLSGPVAGVEDEECLSEYEAEMLRAGAFVAVSSELAPVVIVAAHLGLRVAAAVVVSGSSEKEMRGGRS
jgi:Phosphorylase superfamily